MTAMLTAAFKALGMAPSRRELGLVCDAIRASGDQDSLGLWGDTDDRGFGPGFDRLVEIAEDAGAGFYVALDVWSEVSSPGSVSRYLAAKELGRRVAEGPRR